MLEACFGLYDPSPGLSSPLSYAVFHPGRLGLLVKIWRGRRKLLGGRDGGFSPSTHTCMSLHTHIGAHQEARRCTTHLPSFHRPMEVCYGSVTEKACLGFQSSLKPVFYSASPWHRTNHFIPPSPRQLINLHWGLELPRWSVTPNIGRHRFPLIKNVNRKVFIVRTCSASTKTEQGYLVGRRCLLVLQSV